MHGLGVTDPEADAEDDDIVRVHGERGGLSIVGGGGLVGDGCPAFAVTPHEDERLVLRYHNFPPAITHARTCSTTTLLLLALYNNQHGVVVANK